MTAGIQEITLNDLKSLSGTVWVTLQLEQPPVYKGSLTLWMLPYSDQGEQLQEEQSWTTFFSLVV